MYHLTTTDWSLNCGMHLTFHEEASSISPTKRTLRAQSLMSLSSAGMITWRLLLGSTSLTCRFLIISLMRPRIKTSSLAPPVIRAFISFPSMSFPAEGKKRLSLASFPFDALESECILN
ncbi:hypothetical protein K493DRAFT_78929 [Basidiobolus meristosporus CBS 931.73]|uniref:Uncharacterized protein n=1 Tax=Basidiobolus meristosporus CBS 931.73 TaxID=1314790 RepID=A0A1Y1XS73_9FUNG|nr:hypothetical protein K493DRAFT_78929 [Basidiobolus meristosporus CBS 931.73]|eukprot:ORX88356.1 hypothetical protein K493DRAFT_78929 [Basidiobolus meristosporus CBS 931.73]